MEWKRTLHRWLRRTGYDVVGYVPISHPLARRRKMMDVLGVDLVLDVGANVGQYGQQLRDLGFRGRIVSFEPLRAAYQALSRRVARDADWTALPYALGDSDGTAELHVSEKNVFSSLQAPESLLAAMDSTAAMVAKEGVEVHRLDTLFGELRGSARSVWLKLDVQGHEARVLDGAAGSLAQCAAVQMEMSLRPLYVGERGLRGDLDWADAAGFELCALEPGFSDSRTGRLLQVDGVFLRKA
jgi:FkbM family methyltransferase